MNSFSNQATPSSKYVKLLRAASAKITELETELASLNKQQSSIDSIVVPTATDPIAIVGMGCRFPGGAIDLASFSQLLYHGQDAITDVPNDRWDSELFYNPAPKTPGKIATQRGGFLTNVDSFDAAFFGLSPREVVALDPQQRLLLEVTWEALEHAHIPPDQLFNTLTGVFVGIGGFDYATLLNRAHIQNAYVGTGTAHSTAAGRLSYLLGLRGPSLAIDTACSSSLAAVHLACQSLRQRECDIAIAAGVNLLLLPDNSVIFSQAGMLSPDGHCKTFDAAANGYVRSEGCGVIVLKRLSVAQQAGDPVLALIRGSAINQDGPSGGLTVPNGPAQEAVIQQALQNGGVHPGQISYIEAHGTGTALGDPIEVGALAAVFGGSHSHENPLTVGSVKTNLGHTECAAGLAGLIKVVLQLQHQMIFPHLHFTQPNPHIDWADRSVTVPTQLTPWRVTDGRSLLAGVSSFGFGGTNVHIVLEEAPPLPTTENSANFPTHTSSSHTLTSTSSAKRERPMHLLVITAKYQAALQALADTYIDYLHQHPALDLAAVCHGASTGRSHWQHRLAVIGDSTEIIAQRLQNWLEGTSEVGVCCGQVPRQHSSKLVFLFTGQGSQYQAMGQLLYTTQPVFRETLNHCAELVKPYLDQPLLELIYAPAVEASLLDQTVYAQPALFALEYALYRLWQSWGIEPDVVMGHSVGEYVAACVAGVFSLEDGLMLIATRGQLMQQLPAGGVMVSLMATAAEVRDAIENIPEVTIAAVNGPHSTVISGPETVVQMLVTQLAASEIKHKPLQVSHAFHSPLMQPMLTEFKQVAQRVTYSEPRIHLISNVTGQVATTEVATPEYWCRHILSPVNFVAGMETLIQQGYDMFLECGPKPILLGMGKQCWPEDTGIWLPSLRPGHNDWQQMLTSLGELYVRGVQVDWIGFDQNYPQRCKVVLPTYPFQRKRYWFTTEDVTAMADEQGALNLSRASEGQPQRQDQHNHHSQQREQILASLTTLIAKIFQLPLDEVNIHTPLLEMGADSLILMEMTNEVEKKFGVELSTRQLFEELTTLDALATYLVKTSAVAEIAAVALVPETVPERLTTHHVESNGAKSSSTGPQMPQHPPTQVSNHRLFSPPPVEPRQTQSTGSRNGQFAANGNIETSLERILGQQMQLMSEQLAILREQAPATNQPLTSIASAKVSDDHASQGKVSKQSEQLPINTLLPSPTKQRRLKLPNSVSFVSPMVIAEKLRSQVSDLVTSVDAIRYQEALGYLESLGSAYIIQAFEQMGKTFQLSEQFVTEDLADQLGIAQKYEQLFNRLLQILAEDGILQPVNNQGWKVVNASQYSIQKHLELLLGQYPQAQIETTLLIQCAAQLKAVLQESIDPLSILFPNGDLKVLNPVYKDSLGANIVNNIAQQAITTALAAWPQDQVVKILEIGAGTGGTTTYVLPQLKMSQVEYLFTDIGVSFLVNAKKQFQDYPFVKYQVLDIGQNPQQQGFEPHQWDIVIAANVLHTTANIKQTLSHIRQLIKPQGLLVCIEGITPRRCLDLTFGLLDGWWGFKDTDLRPNYPLLDRPTWRRVLTETGFAESITLPEYFGQVGVDFHQLVFVAQATMAAISDAPQFQTKAAQIRSGLISTHQQAQSSLTPQQQDYFHTFVNRYIQQTQKSRHQTQASRSVLADSRAVAGFRLTTKDLVYPIIGHRYEGARCWDIDGNEYVDLAMGFGVHLFGHNVSFINQAIEAQLKLGVSVGPQAKLSAEVAQRLCEMVGAERATFCQSGTEAVMTALRLARVATGRQKIALFRESYHGHFDGVLARRQDARLTIENGNGDRNGIQLESLPIAAGIDPDTVRNVVVLDYGDPTALDWLRQWGSELAAVLVEPVQSRNPGLQPRDFLHELRHLTHICGAVLIFDEIITGFRIHPGGAQAFFGVQADLATYSKTIGGGLPFAAIAGKAQLMNGIDGGPWNYGDDSYPDAPRTFFAGTFNKYALGLATARAVLMHLQASGPQLQLQLNERTESLVNRLNQLFDKQQVPITVVHFGSLFRFVVKQNLDIFFYHLIEKGVYIWEGRNCFLSTAHTDADIEHIVKAVQHSITDLQHGGFLAYKAEPSNGQIQSVSSIAQTVASAKKPTAQIVTIPLTAAQRQLWRLAQINEAGSLAYHVSTCLDLRGDLNYDILQLSLQALVNRHESLRTIIDPDGQTQHILPHITLDVERVDWTHIRPEQQASDLASWFEQENHTPFSLTKGPLFRAHTLRLAPQHHYLVLTIHHMVIDGWSLGVLLKEFGEMYTSACRGLESPLQPIQQFRDYTQWQTEQLLSERMATHASYWLDQFSDSLSILEFPKDYPRPAISSFRNNRLTRPIDASLRQHLQQFSQQQGCTLFMTLLATYLLLLHRLTDQTEIVVGVPVSGRFYPESKEIIGYIAHIVLIRSIYNPVLTFNDYLKQVRSTLLDAYEHQDYPFASLLDRLRLRTNRSHSTSWASTTFNLESSIATPSIGELTVALQPQPIHFGYSDMHLDVFDIGDELLLQADYNSDIFRETTIQQWLEHFCTLLLALLKDSTQSIAKLPLLTADERHQLVVEWNNTATDCPKDQCIHQLFEAQVTRTPETVAVVFGDQQLSYRELNEQANQLAHYLQQQGVGPESLIGICVQPSLKMVVGILGILKAGGAYFPLDLSYPSERLQGMMNDARITIVLSQASLLSTLPECKAQCNVQIVCLDRDWDTIQTNSTDNPFGVVTAKTLAYVLDGVGVGHQAVIHRLAWLHSSLEMSKKDVVLYKADLKSDSVVVELWLPLCYGEGVVISTAAEAQDPVTLQSVIAEYQITHIHLWPSEVLLWLNTSGADSLDSLRWVLCSGEYFGQDSLQATDLASFTERFGVGIKHCYSLPEAGGEITDGAWQRESESVYVPVGAPGRMSVYVLDCQQQLVPVGVSGEIYVGGPGLAQAFDSNDGFYGFVDHSHFGRLLRTGERGRRYQDGYLELIESLDRHVWVKGHRISLGAIETVLLSSPSVDQAYVLARGGELVAYVVVVGPCVSQQLQEHMSAHVPLHQRPTHYVPISNLPLTPQGTVDETMLVQCPVIDNELIQQWEFQFQSLPTVEEVAVVTQPMVDHDLPLHLSDLLPTEPLIQSDPELESQPADREKRNGGQSVADTPAPYIPAFSEGPPLEWDSNLTLVRVLQRTAQVHGETPITYIRADGTVGHQTYAQLWQEAQSIMTGLRQLGIKPQDKVIFLLEDNQDFLSGFWGCILGGFIPVPVSIPPSYEQEHSSLTKLHHTWQMLDSPLVLTSAELSSKLRGWSQRLKLSGFNIEMIETLRASEAESDCYVAQPDDVVLMLLTSGSTGMPKAVTHNHQTLLSRSVATVAMNHFSHEDISLNWFPFDHVGGIVMFHVRDVYLGCHQIHAPTAQVLDQPTRWLDWIEQYRVTITWAPNFAFELINQAISPGISPYDLSSLKFILNAGEAIVAKTTRTFLQQLQGCGLPLTAMHPAWGMSETASAVTFSSTFTLETTDDTQTFVEVGAPIPGMSIRITNRQQQIVTEGEIGAIQIKGPSVTLGYYQSPEATQSAFTDDGWFSTGDLGFLRAGQLTITGRQKDVIIINGLNYYSHEIEAVVDELVGISASFTAACAIRRPNSSTDQLALFFHTPYTEESERLGILTSIRDQVVQRIGINPSYLVPLEQAAIPKTAIGKIQRSKLAQSLMDGAFDELIKKVDRLSGNSRTIPDWFYQRMWVRKQLITGQEQRLQGFVLVFVDRLGLGDALCQSFADMGQPAITVEIGIAFEQVSNTRYRLCPDAVDDYHQLCQCLSHQQIQIGAVVHLWHYDDESTTVNSVDELDAVQKRGIDSLLSLVQAFEKSQGDSTPVQLLYGANHTQVVQDGDEMAYAKSTVSGMLKTIAQEFAHWRCRHLDLPSNALNDNCEALVKELNGVSKDTEVAYRGEQRWVARIDKCAFDEPTQSSVPLKPGGIYVISGGLGGIGIELSRYLLETYQARLILLGRTPLPDVEVWSEGLLQGGAIAEKIAHYQQLQQLPGSVVYYGVDVGSLAEVKAVVGKTLAEWSGSLDGVVHLAGLYHEQCLVDETPERLRQAMRPKVQGAWVLHQLLQSCPDALFIHSSSLVGQFGGATVGAYAAANSFLMGLSQYQRGMGRSQSYCFVWSTWVETGMSQDYEMKYLTRAQGYQDMSVIQGVNSLVAGLCQSQSVLLVGLDGTHANVCRFRPQVRAMERLTAFVSPLGMSQDLEMGEQSDRFGTPSHCAVVTLEKLPRTETGAIDCDGLTQHFIRTFSGRERIRPRTELEHQIAQIWQDVLGIKSISIHDNFFELGGNSLLATQVVSRLKKLWAIEVTLQTLFESPTIEGIVQRIDLLPSLNSRAIDSFDIQPVSRAGHLPVSFAQQRLWFLEKMALSGNAYNGPLTLEMQGQLNVLALQTSLSQLIARHEPLRTRFGEENGTPIQLIDAPFELPLPITDLQDIPFQEKTPHLHQQIRQANEQLFNLEVDFPIRAQLFKLSDTEHMLLILIHHIASDGWSLKVLAQDLSALYEAALLKQPSRLSPLPIQYADFAVWQRQWLQGETLEAQLRYWKTKLYDLTPLQLPTDYPRPAVETFNGAGAAIELSASLSAQLKQLAQSSGATLFMVLLAGFKVLLWRYSGQDSITVGSPIANRNRSEIEGLIGFFVNSLVMHTDLSGNPSFTDVLSRVRQTALEAYAHQDLPFEKLVEELQPERSLNHHPLFQVLFALQQQDVLTPNFSLPNLEVSLYRGDDEDITTRFDIELHLWPHSDGIKGLCTYNRDLFETTTIQRLLNHYQTVLAAIAATPDTPISELSLLSPSERQQLVLEWNQTAADYPADHCIHHLFERQAETTPDRVAVVFGEEQLTYGELSTRATQLCHYLYQCGVGPGQLVGICIERSIEMVIGILAILKVGAAYVPLDASYPQQRLSVMAETAEISLLLTQSSLRSQFSALPITSLCLDSEGSNIAQCSSQAFESDATPQSLAYVIFTSGSTGHPKGVAMSHAALVNLISWQQRITTIDHGPKTLQFAPISFDVSVQEIFATWCSGGILVLCDEDIRRDPQALLKVLEHEQIERLFLPFVALQQLAEAANTSGAKLSCLREVFTAGEQLQISPAIAHWFKSMPQCQLQNQYGPSESHVVTAFTLKGDVDQWPLLPPIGRPIANSQIYVLDQQQQPVAIGMVGELYIGGVGLAQGYINRPELTQEKFIANPHSAKVGDRLYRTGDLVRYQPDGNIEFLGRVDHQVKIRGFRIETGEIEAVVRQCEGVKDAVVMVDEAEANKRLVGYLIAQSSSTLLIPELRQFIKEQLPDYMIPAAFVVLDEWPLTPSGKVDRKALPTAHFSHMTADYVAPRTPTEQAVAEIWSSVLGIQSIGMDDNFFDSGGHSLLATQVISRLQQIFDIPIPVRQLFECPTVRELSQAVVAAQRSGLVMDEVYRSIPSVDRDRPIPLSFAQQRLWFLDKMCMTGNAYNMPFVLHLRGQLDRSALQVSLNQLIARHEPLRTHFGEHDGTPVQLIDASFTVKLSLVDLSTDPCEQQEVALHAQLQQAIAYQFDLHTQPPIRVQLFQLSKTEHVLLILLHHIASDGWSLTVLSQDLSSLYKAALLNHPSHLPPLPIQYADFAVWQRQWLQGETLETQLSYWKTKLRDLTPLQMPTDHPRPAVETFNGAGAMIELSSTLTDQLQQLAQQSGATLFMVLLAGFKVLLSRYTGQESIAVGSPIANRNRSEIEGLIGFFVNSLVLHTDLSGNPSFTDVLSRVRQTALEAYAHQDLPFEKLVEELQPERSLNHHPLFQVVFALQQEEILTPNFSLPNLDVSWYQESEAEITTRFDIELHLWPHSDGIKGLCTYNRDLYEPATIERLLSYYQTILESVVALPDRPISQQSLLSSLERHQLVVEWNQTAADYPAEYCIHQLFERQAATTPDRVAVVFGEERLSYRELNARANQLCHYLYQYGVGPGQLVGICIERSIEMVIGILAILKVGAAYVPLDASYPQQRLSFMAETAKISLLLTQSSLRSQFSVWPIDNLCLDSEWPNIAQCSSQPFESDANPQSLAYVIFTSGSTGHPKGVAMGHSALVNLISWQQRITTIDHVPRTLQFAPISFDVSVQEIFATWCAGGTLVLCNGDIRRDPQALVQVLEHEQIERLFLPFVALQQLAETANSSGVELRCLREVFTAGEQLQISPAIAHWFKSMPQCHLQNQYGPSESHVVTAFTLPENVDQWPLLPPIGQPIANSQMYVLDPYQQPVAIGMVGELYIGGVGLAEGYINRPGLTQEKFIPNPHSSDAGDRLYRTGDLVRYQPDGNIEFLGRIDHQVKIRGFRIETGEIEAVVRQCEGINDSVVMVDGVGVDKRLVGYLIAHSSLTLSVPDLRRVLKERLPDYMVPAAFVVLDEWPLTPSGKVDRKALPAPDLTHVTVDYVAPRTPTEQAVAEIWSSVLGVQSIGVDDNFFDSGGHSLLATQVISRLQKTFDIPISVRQLFEGPTVRELSQAVVVAQRSGLVMDEVYRSIPSVDRDGPIPLSFAQQRLWFLEKMGLTGNAYNMPLTLHLKGHLDLRALQSSLDQLAIRHEPLRTRFVERDGTPIQAIDAPSGVGLRLVDFTHLPAEQHAIALQAHLQQSSEYRFNLSQDPPIKAELFSLSETEHVLLILLHHIASDGWSLTVLTQDFSALYESSLLNHSSRLSPLPIQYADFAVWQRQWLQGEALETQLSYWKRKLQTLLPLQLPTDYPRPAVETFNGAGVAIDLPSSLSAQLQQLAQSSGATLFMVLLAGFKVLLSRYSGQNSIVVGSPIANRNRSEIEGLIGFFVNSLVLHTDLSGNPSFTDVLSRVRQTALEAYANQDLPFEKLVEELQPERSLSRNPLVQVMFALQQQEILTPNFSLPNLEVGWYQGSGAEMTTRFDIELHLWPSIDGLKGFCTYNRDLFEPATIERLLGHYEVLLASIVAAPDTPIGHLTLFPAPERQRLLVEWNQTATSYPAEHCIHQLVEAQAEKTPDAVAVVFDEQRLSYGELNARSEQLACYLQQQGVKVGDLVGICVERSIEMVIGLLGILKAGGAYVPLDPSYPQHRLTHMLADSQISVLLSQNRIADTLPCHSAQVIALEEDWLTSPGTVQCPAPSESALKRPAYMIYTSGSTGTPKGVLISHRGLLNLAMWHLKTFAVSASDRTTQMAAIAFDAAGWEIWPTLVAGACLNLVPPDLVLSPVALQRWLIKQAITVSFVPTPIAQELLLLEWSSETPLRILLTGGDRLSQYPPAELPFSIVNNYGPTENSVVTTSGVVALKSSSLVQSSSIQSSSIQPSIGKAIANTQVYILDRHLNPVPIGVPGELHIGGDGLAIGYHNRPDLTQEKFIAHPFSDEPDARLYKTGDLVRYRSDGNIEFLGRIDHQVKIRGFRIETGEIEATLTQHASVQDAVVVARAENSGDKRLVAYVVPHSDTANEAQPELADTQVSSWQGIFNQQVYTDLSEVNDPLFNMQGWLSNYDNQLIPEAQMRVWATDIVTQVLSTQPKSVWEIGCGTGMLLFQLAPHTQHYYGSDISQVSLEYVQAQIDQRPAQYGHVELEQRQADHMAGIEDHRFDVVLLSSIVQYFPNIDYLLTVIEQSVRVVKPGGVIVLADIRSYPLMRAFHSSVQHYKASPSTSVQELNQAIERQIQQETEFFVDPEFFVALKDHYPAISQVQVRLQRGSDVNELTKYRYTVLLHVESSQRTVIPEQVNGIGMNREAISHYLRQVQLPSSGDAICFSQLANGRLMEDMRVVEQLSDPTAAAITMSHLDQQVLGPSFDKERAVDPEQLHQLAVELGYHVELCWSVHCHAGQFDAVFVPVDTVSKAIVLSPLTQRQVIQSQWQRYSNNPLAKQQNQQLVPQLKTYLEERLPEYMLPAHWMVLPQLPLTANGKVARKALPAPNTINVSNNFIAPQTPTEHAIAEIWADVLNLKKVGIHDNFFDLGGHSLLATQAISRIQQAFERELPLKLLFDYPEISVLAEYIENICWAERSLDQAELEHEEGLI